MITNYTPAASEVRTGARKPTMVSDWKQSSDCVLELGVKGLLISHFSIMILRGKAGYIVY